MWSLEMLECEVSICEMGLKAFDIFQDLATAVGGVAVVVARSPGAEDELCGCGVGLRCEWRCASRFGGDVVSWFWSGDLFVEIFYGGR